LIVDDGSAVSQNARERYAIRERKQRKSERPNAPIRIIDEWQVNEKGTVNTNVKTEKREKREKEREARERERERERDFF